MSTTGRSGLAHSQDTFALVLAGGNGTRLGELTRWQCKPAVPFAGHFRNIDFTLSNCINSGLRRVAVLTQYKAQTLITHIGSGWSFLPRALGEFVEVWPAQQRLHNAWYAGTADAVYQNLDLVLAQRSPYTLVLAGDHIYKMDYRRLIEQHAASGAGVTIGCIPVPLEEAGGVGVLGIDERLRVSTFIEKPAPSALPSTAGSTVLASMGIYAFSTEYLVDVLTRDAGAAESVHDFGRNVLPTAVHEGRASAHLFLDEAGRPGYWRDVGTVDSYWQTHMDLLSAQPPIDLYDPAWPIHTLPEGLPPARLCDAGRQSLVSNTLLGGGTVIRGATVTNSVLSTNVHVGENSMIDEAVLLPNVRVGANCRVRRVIVDSGVEVPDGTVVGWPAPGHIEHTLYTGNRIVLLTREVAVSDELRSVA